MIGLGPMGRDGGIFCNLGEYVLFLFDIKAGKNLPGLYVLSHWRCWSREYM